MNQTQGSALLTLRTFYHTLRISVPTVLEGAIGKTSAARCDARLLDWAQTLVRITRTSLTVTGHEHFPAPVSYTHLDVYKRQDTLSSPNLGEHCLLDVWARRDDDARLSAE